MVSASNGSKAGRDGTKGAQIVIWLERNTYPVTGATMASRTIDGVKGKHGRRLPAKTIAVLCLLPETRVPGWAGGAIVGGVQGRQQAGFKFKSGLTVDQAAAQDRGWEAWCREMGESWSERREGVWLVFIVKGYRYLLRRPEISCGYREGLRRWSLGRFSLRATEVPSIPRLELEHSNQHERTNRSPSHSSADQLPDDAPIKRLP